jgi:tocopherol O-methyltransferase
MKSVISSESIILANEIIDYYEECWLTRFHEGHNPRSLAMHMGFFDEATLDNEEAKLNMNAFLARQLGLNKDSEVSILDAGCGVGGTCFFLAEKYPHISITGLNLSDLQLTSANRFMQERKVTGQVTFVVGDYAHAPFDDRTFDMIYLVESLCHALDKTLIYNEAMRLLKPGGRLVILDYVQLTTYLDDSSAVDLGDFQRGWTVKQYLIDPKRHLLTSGFEEVEVRSLTTYVLPGIGLSAERSSHKLASLNGYAGNTLMVDHFKACVALQKLVSKRIIDYSLISCRKPM